MDWPCCQDATTKTFIPSLYAGLPPTRWKDQIPKDTGMEIQQAECSANGIPEWRMITRERAKGHPVLCRKKYNPDTPV
jgi:hypothetical protein